MDKIMYFQHDDYPSVLVKRDHAVEGGFAMWKGGEWVPCPDSYARDIYKDQSYFSPISEAEVVVLFPGATAKAGETVQVFDKPTPKVTPAGALERLFQ